MKIYQFIKFDENTTISHIKNAGDERLIICFDFEDGLMKHGDYEGTVNLKKEGRKKFLNVYGQFNKQSKLGVRLNAIKNPEFEKDVHALSNLTFHSVFLPKIQSVRVLNDIIKELHRCHIGYKEIIPVIENRAGLDRTSEIANHPEVNNIAFGHCDYNLCAGVFPFFHQENFEYWKWIKKILSQIEPDKTCFINSPYLHWSNEKFYIAMLGYLKTLTGNNFGQITLTNQQTTKSLKFSGSDLKFNMLLQNRLNYYPAENYAENIIAEYEEYNSGKGLSKSVDRIISVQEYQSAVKLASENNRNKLRIAFIGGCFPVQYDILAEDIFLNITGKLFMENSSVMLETDIIRYERFSDVFGKLKDKTRDRNFKAVVLSIRPEPYLRMIKLYYRYRNNEGCLKHSLNFHLIDINESENYDLLSIGRTYYQPQNKRTSKYHNSLVDLNYMAGCLIGNRWFALSKIKRLIIEIEDYCRSNRIEFILMGPNLRSQTKIEPALCTDLDNMIHAAFPNLSYINGLYKEYGKAVFRDNGTHVNELYHQLTAQKLFVKLSEYDS
ncbi:aldolase/citrate lyase family protein [Saccharicrinis sp. FJH62]|uniref:aldolase/citrate lyase family protein n=1 Tax=Saccharicrinis sp. FJH62 TaxID=3344657 RepID=UPI0035D4B8E1